MRLRSTLIEESLPDLLTGPMHTLAQLQRRAESLSSELAVLKQQVNQQAHTASALARLQGHETILIADDHAITRSIAQEILAGFGYQLLLSDSTLRDMPVKLTIDLVLMNVPLLNIEQRTRLTRIQAQAVAAKLVVCTPLPEGPARNRLRDWGVDGFVSKPYQPLALASCIRRVLDL